MENKSISVCCDNAYLLTKIVGLTIKQNNEK